jgi:flagellar motor protein MotB
MKNSVLFMGLFLMAFALYANERNQVPVTVVAPQGQATEVTVQDVPVTGPNKPVVEGVSSDAPSKGADTKLQALFQSFVTDSLFSTHADGLKLVREPRAIMIQLYGDDVFSEGEIEIRETWYSVLDRIAAKLTKEEFQKGLKVEIRGFADEASQRELKSSDFGRSDFSFSFARAEWLARYFERKWRIPLQEVFTLKGMGARPYGKKVELWLSY